MRLDGDEQTIEPGLKCDGHVQAWFRQSGSSFEGNRGRGEAGLVTGQPQPDDGGGDDGA